MKKIKIILVLVLVLILLVGCTSLPGLSFLGGKQDKPVIGRGIKMSFMPGAPPTDKIIVSSNSKFLVRVQIDNYSPVQVQGKLKFWDNIPGGVEEHGQAEYDALLEPAQPIFRNNDPNQPIININPSNNLFPKEPLVISYTPETIARGTNLNLFAEWSTTTDYVANIQTSFCLKREADVNVPCSNQEVITSAKFGADASYAPVTIDRIEKSATPFNDNQFYVNLKIVLKNLGGGEIIDASGRKDLLTNFNLLVDGSSSGDCSVGQNVGQVSFSNNEAVVNCVIDGLTAGQSYTDHKLVVSYSFPYKLRIKAGPIPLSVIGNR
ncbi:MAG: hypothetical protein AABX29_02510 [Nanoarchaeota archaeon]